MKTAGTSPGSHPQRHKKYVSVNKRFKFIIKGPVSVSLY